MLDDESDSDELDNLENDDSVIDETNNANDKIDRTTVSKTTIVVKGIGKSWVNNLVTKDIFETYSKTKKEMNIEQGKLHNKKRK